MTKRQENGLIALCSLLYFTSYFTRKNFAAVMVEMISLSLFDKTFSGLVVGALFITYGAGQILSGFLGDKFSPTTLIMTGLVMTTVCNAAMPAAAVGMPWLLLPLSALNGLAQALFWPPLVRLLAENLTHDRFVQANLVVTVAAHSATILIFLFTALCLSYLTWEVVFYAPAMLGLLTLVVWPLGTKKIGRGEQKQRPGMPAPQAISAKQFLPLLFSAGLVPILLVIVMQGYLRDGIDSWLPTFFSEVFSQSTANSALSGVIMPIFSILSVYIAGFVHRHLIRNEVGGALFFYILSLLFGILLLFTMQGEGYLTAVLSLVLIALFSGCMHATNFMLISCLPSRFAPYGRAATASGICNAATYIGSATASYGIALTSELFGWTATVLSWLGIALLGLLICVPTLYVYRRFLKKQEG